MKNEPRFYPINTADAQAIKHRIRFIFLAVVLALVGITLTVFGPQFLPRTKYFTSTATIEINEGPMNLGGLPLSPIQPGTIIRLPNYADELKKESILSKVVESLKLTERLIAPDKPIGKAEAVRILQKTLVVKQTGLSLFKITAFNADRSLAAEIANAVVVAYKEERLKIARGDSENVLAEMREELDVKRGEAKRLFAACSQLRIKYEIIDQDPESADSELSIATEKGQTDKSAYSANIPLRRLTIYPAMPCSTRWSSDTPLHGSTSFSILPLSKYWSALSRKLSLLQQTNYQETRYNFRMPTFAYCSLSFAAWSQAWDSPS